MADFYTYRNEVAGRRRKRRLFLILIVVLAALCIGVGYFWFTRQSAPAQTSPAESATPEQAASAAVPTEAPSAAPADIAEPQRILPGVDTAAWDKSEAVAATIDTEYRNTDHRMVAVPMLGTVTNDYFNTVTFAGDSIASGLGIYDTGYHNAHYATYVSAGVHLCQQCQRQERRHRCERDSDGNHCRQPAGLSLYPCRHEQPRRAGQ